MIPETNSSLLEIDDEHLPSKTFALDINAGRIRGNKDGREALEQAIFLILSTRRYAHLIYSWNYGSETDNLIGQPKDYAYPEIKRCITEALLQDDRILEVSDFNFSSEKSRVLVTFTAKTIFGNITTEVPINV